MPRKTRKEKKQLDTKRDSFPVTYSYTAHVSKSNQVTPSIGTLHLKRDIAKTLVIGIMFISFEVILSFIL